MDNPWQLCRTIGPLLSQKFPLASVKAQPRGGGYFPFPAKPEGANTCASRKGKLNHAQNKYCHDVISVTQCRWLLL